MTKLSGCRSTFNTQLKFCTQALGNKAIIIENCEIDRENREKLIVC